MAARESSWLRHYVRIARQPRIGFAELLAGEHPLRLGALALLSNVVVYTLVYVFLILGHGRPTVFGPWLAIDPEQYYRWNVFLLAPSMTMAWLLAGAVSQLLSRALGGRGAFEETLSALGFGTAIASWATALHDLTTTFLGALLIIDQRAYEDALSSPTPFRTLLWILMTAYVIAFVGYYAAAIEAAHGLRRPRALAVAACAFATYQLVFVVFNR